MKKLLAILTAACIFASPVFADDSKANQEVVKCLSDHYTQGGNVADVADKCHVSKPAGEDLCKAIKTATKDRKLPQEFNSLCPPK